jgi:YHS domain-containing protein
MVNNKYMATPQIPVDVAGNTYFGCCAMCKTRLEEEAESRTARDPLSGATVDKANVVIGKNASGDVFYFENESNLQEFAIASTAVRSARR